MNAKNDVISQPPKELLTQGHSGTTKAVTAITPIPPVDLKEIPWGVSTLTVVATRRARRRNLGPAGRL